MSLRGAQRRGNLVQELLSAHKCVRTTKIAGNEKHEYVTQNGKVVRELVTNKTTGAFIRCLDFLYDESGKPFAMRRYWDASLSSYGTYHYVLNAQGDVVQINYQGGEVKATYTYDAWGRVLTADGELAAMNPIRYRGYYYDTDTGFYYLQSRYYDSVTHRFINADAIASTGQGFVGTNMFAYCNNSPVFCADYDGKNTDILDWWAGAMWWLCGADSVLPVGDIIYGGGLLILGAVVWFTADEATDASVPQIYIEEDEEKAEPEIPDVTYPGDDPTKAPEGYEWKGPDAQGGERGGYANPNGKDSWHPDLNHSGKIGPHWDYNDGYGHKWRVFPVL